MLLRDSSPREKDREGRTLVFRTAVHMHIHTHTHTHTYTYVYCVIVYPNTYAVVSMP